MEELLIKVKVVQCPHVASIIIKFHSIVMNCIHNVINVCKQLRKQQELIPGNSEF